MFPLQMKGTTVGTAMVDNVVFGMGAGRKWKKMCINETAVENNGVLLSVPTMSSVSIEPSLSSVFFSLLLTYIFCQRSQLSHHPLLVCCFVYANDFN